MKNISQYLKDTNDVRFIYQTGVVILVKIEVQDKYNFNPK